MNFEYTWEMTSDSFGEYYVEVDVEYEYTPRVPAKTHGRFEDGCPAEGGEIEIKEVRVCRAIEHFSDHSRDIDLHPFQTTFLERRFMDEVSDTEEFRELLLQDAMEAEDSGRDIASEDRRHARKGKGI